MARMRANEHGVVLSIVVISLLMMTSVAYGAVMLAYNQARIFNSISGARVVSYYRAQAGLVDAFWRIQNLVNTNMTTNTASCTDSGGSNFSNPNWCPNSYGLDIDPDPPVVSTPPSAASDATVSIGPVNGNGVRSIDVTGVDT